jgi:hypothetical protein
MGAEAQAQPGRQIHWTVLDHQQGSILVECEVHFVLAVLGLDRLRRAEEQDE